MIYHTIPTTCIRTSEELFIHLPFMFIHGMILQPAVTLSVSMLLLKAHVIYINWCVHNTSTCKQTLLIMNTNMCNMHNIRNAIKVSKTKI